MNKSASMIDSKQLGLAVSQMTLMDKKMTKKNEISLKDKIVLGPIDRYKKYDHFPWKLILHISLIAITSFQVITIVGYQTDFAYNG